MKGNIYTRQKCLVCGGRLVHDEKRQGCFCEAHPEVQAVKGFYLKFGKDINKRFKTYALAYHYLIGLRYEVEQEKFDVRDHLFSNPLGFSNLAANYLAFKEKQNLASFYHIKRYLNRASDFFQGTNVKNIKKKDIRAFLDSLTKVVKGIEVPLSDKSKANFCTQLHDFYYNYLYEEEEVLTLAQLPKFPKVEYELGFRKLVDIETREKIVDRIRETTYPDNPKIWLGIDMLCSYGKIQPMDLRRLKEGDIDLEYGFLTFWRPSKSKKRKKPKVVAIKLLDYHIEEIERCKKLYPATDQVLFFRHTPTNSRQPNEPFGKDYLYRAWNKACKELGIDDLDLYGGTRHSSTTAIGKVLGKKRARDYSGHDTNEAFDRYCQIGDRDDFDISQLMAKMRGN